MKIETQKIKGINSDDVFCRFWTPEASSKALIIIQHGYAEHSARYEEAARILTDQGYAVAAMDLPGHGKSSGKRAFTDNFGKYVDELDNFISIAKNSFPDIPVFLLGHSMGGAISIMACMKNINAVDGLILSGAAIRLTSFLPQNAIYAISEKLASHMPERGLIKLSSKLVSRDKKVVKAYEKDPLCYHGPIPFSTLREMSGAGLFIEKNMKMLTTPVLILHGGSDRITDPAGSRMLYSAAGSPERTLKIFNGLYHEIISEPEKEAVFKTITEWIRGKVSDNATQD